MIDDSKAIRSILKKMMESFGFETFEAANGRDAMKCLREMKNCDVVLVDWNMPVMSGLDFVKELRSIAFFKKTKIMMVTTESGMSGMKLALAEGADEYVMKPFNKEIVFDKLIQLGLLPMKE
ncbi:MAG: response regulator [Deltaproteobacteria bacterium]|nr:response regulator [Deltaproteobacteria bacterium]